MKYTFLTDDPFASKVEKTPTCWNWTGGTKGAGYGQINVRIGGRKTTAGAHRVAYEMEHGDIPEGMEIDHICHNRLCVNLAHLRMVTHKQNIENSSGPPTNNTSGYRGVNYMKHNRNWRAMVVHHGDRIVAGYFATAEEANAAVIALRIELYTHNDADRTAA